MERDPPILRILCVPSKHLFAGKLVSPCFIPFMLFIVRSLSSGICELCAFARVNSLQLGRLGERPGMHLRIRRVADPPGRLLIGVLLQESSVLRFRAEFTLGHP